MQALRETDKTKTQRDRLHGEIKDYSLQHRVEIQWDLNEDATRERMCRLIIDDYEVIVDVEELMRYLRWV